MKAAEFLRKVKRYAKKNELTLEWIPAQGKGSHGTLRIGENRTTLKDLKKEVGKGLLKSMCDDLGIKADDL